MSQAFIEIQFLRQIMLEGFFTIEMQHWKVLYSDQNISFDDFILILSETEERRVEWPQK